MDELISGVGSVDKAAALKSLITWVDLGVLKEENENTFRLLEVAEEPVAGARETRPGGRFPLDLSESLTIAVCRVRQLLLLWKILRSRLYNNSKPNG